MTLSAWQRFTARGCNKGESQIARPTPRPPAAPWTK
jgi:hypothetical protein